jgi:hypothetical protein
MHFAEVVGLPQHGPGGQQTGSKRLKPASVNHAEPEA